MINDIGMYRMSYELWSYTLDQVETLFYKEYINGELTRFTDVTGVTVEIDEVSLLNSILVDDDVDLIPEWLRSK